VEASRDKVKLERKETRRQSCILEQYKHLVHKMFTKINSHSMKKLRKAKKAK